MTTAFQADTFQSSTFQIDAALTLEEVMRARLLANSSVASMVSDRIVPDVSIAQLGPSPILVYSRLNSGEDYDLEGNGYREIVRIEYSCIASNWKTARQLLELVRTAALSSRGTFSGITIASVFVADIREQGFNPLTNSYHIDLDLEVHRIL